MPELEPPDDILKAPGQRKEERILVGFAAETDESGDYDRLRSSLAETRSAAIAVRDAGSADADLQSDGHAWGLRRDTHSGHAADAAADADAAPRDDALGDPDIVRDRDSTSE